MSTAIPLGFLLLCVAVAAVNLAAGMAVAAGFWALAALVWAFNLGMEVMDR